MPPQSCRVHRHPSPGPECTTPWRTTPDAESAVPRTWTGQDSSSQHRPPVGRARPDTWTSPITARGANPGTATRCTVIP